MFGFAAIIVDLGAARSTGNDAQNATDASVLAAANALYGDDAVTGPNFPAAVAAAKSYAQENYGTAPSEWASPGCADPGHRDYMPGGTECISFDEEENPTTVRVRIPPRHVGSFFGGIVGYDGLTISTVAEASTESVPQECVVCVFDELSVDLAGKLSVTGGGSVHAGSIEMPGGSAAPTPGKISVADPGEIAATTANPASGISRYDPNPPRLDLASVQDPLSVAPPPADASPPSSVVCNAANPLLAPGTYLDITVPGGGTCQFADGLYRINGSVHFGGGADLVGGNVTLFFTCTEPPGCADPDAPRLDGSGTVTFTGWDDTGGWNPTHVTLLYRTDNHGRQEIGGGQSIIGGTVYAPGAVLNVQDAQTIVAHRVIVDGLDIQQDAELRVNVPLATIEPSGFGLSK